MRKWIYCLCIASVLVGALQASAQIRPPRRTRNRIIVDPSAKKPDIVKADIGASLKDIAKRATQHAENPKVDIVFVVDGSRRMSGALIDLEKRLVDMLAVIEAKTMDYRFALVSFQSVNGEPKQTFHQWTFDYIGIENALREIRFDADNVTTSRYGLDALVEGLNELDFREGVTTQFVAVTNTRMRTLWTEADAKDRISEQIIDRCHRHKVQLNFIGMSEQVQAELADRTNGKWYPINSGQRRIDAQRIESGETVVDKALLRVDGLFRRIAENLVASRPDKVDVIFVFDYSLSMQTKTEPACDGLDQMIVVFTAARLDYRFGIIRFWAAIGGVTSMRSGSFGDSFQRQVAQLTKGEHYIMPGASMAVTTTGGPDQRR